MSRHLQPLALALALIAAADVGAQDATSGVAPGAGAVYRATPPPPFGSTGGAAAPAPMAPGGAAGDGAASSRLMTGSDAAPAAPGAGVEIISGGAGSSDGAAKVGRLPVLQ